MQHYAAERRKFAVATLASFGSAVLLLVTVSWPDWVELVFHTDPDHGSGWLEWSIMGAAAFLTLFAGWRARRSARALRAVRAMRPAIE